MIERAGKQGLASAYLEGFTVAFGLNAKRIVQMDADLSHDPNDVPRLTASQSALAIGSRYVPGGGTKLARTASFIVSFWVIMGARMARNAVSRFNLRISIVGARNTP